MQPGEVSKGRDGDLPSLSMPKGGGVRLAEHGRAAGRALRKANRKRREYLSFIIDPKVNEMSWEGLKNDEDCSLWSQRWA